MRVWLLPPQSVYQGHGASQPGTSLGSVVIAKIGRLTQAGSPSAANGEP
jgi:hypothetical protein